MICSGEVVVSLAVTNDYYVYPHNSSEFPLGPGEATSNLLANITALFRLHLILLSNYFITIVHIIMFSAGASCASGSGDQACNGTFASLEQSP